MSASGKKYSVADHLRRAQRAHQLKAEGMSLRGIARELEAHRTTVDDWLFRGAPTDTDIANAERVAQYSGGEGKLSVRAYLSTELGQALEEECKHTGSSRSQLVGIALEFYLTAIDRYRTGSNQPVDLKTFVSATSKDCSLVATYG
jgi:DNA-binding transcriptional MerR regulator